MHRQGQSDQKPVRNVSASHLFIGFGNVGLDYRRRRSQAPVANYITALYTNYPRVHVNSSADPFRNILKICSNVFTSHLFLHFIYKGAIHHQENKS